MPMPVATLTSETATGDTVVGPGAITILGNGLPMACMGDIVAGGVCVGSISVTESLVLLNGRPAATLVSDVIGVNPESGVPVTTIVAESDTITEIF